MPHSDPGRRGRALVIVCGESVYVPFGTSLLDALATVGAGAVADGDYCRSGECAHCEVVWRDAAGVERVALACLQPVVDGMQIVDLSRYIRKDLGR